MKKFILAGIFAFSCFSGAFAQEATVKQVGQTGYSTEDIMASAEKGDLAAQEFLAYMYKDGHEVKQSDKEAFKWFLKAAEQGSSQAILEIGEMYLEGKGVEKDAKKAFEYIEKAAASGNGTAMHFLGKGYRDGKDLPQNFVLAHFWFSRGENVWGSLSEECTKAILRMKAEMSDAQLKEALTMNFVHIEKSAATGSPNSLFELGQLYLEGKGTEKSIDQAFNFFHKAAEMGVLAAQYQLGIEYRDGINLQKDNFQAYFWLAICSRDFGKPTRSRFLPLSHSAMKALEAEMSADQALEAGKKADAWQPKTWEEVKDLDTNAAPPASSTTLKNGFYLVIEEQLTREALQSPAPDELLVKYSIEHLGVTGQPPRYYRVKTTPDVPFTLKDTPVLEDRSEGKTSLNIVLGSGNAEKFQQFTRNNINKAVAIIIDGKVITAHKIRAEITGGKIQITRCGDDACQALFYLLQN